MNILFSLLYAPLVFISLQHFDLKIVSIIIFCIAIIWFFISLKKSYKETIFPLFYIVISILAFSFNDFIFLKTLPLIISTLVSSYFFYSYFTNNSFILIILDRFKKEVTKEEKEYIQRSTLFWCVTSLLNIFIHLIILLSNDMNYWLYYSSIGWYFIFISAFIVQMIHLKMFFKKVHHV